MTGYQGPRAGIAAGMDDLRGHRRKHRATQLTWQVRVSRTVSDGWVMTWRNLMNTLRNPQVLGFTAAQPVLFVLLFAYVFAGAIPIEGGGYREYLIPGIFAQTLVFNAVSTSVGMAEDVQRGLVDRFRSLPVARSAVLVGRTFGDTARNLLVMLLIIVCGLIVGWRIREGIVDAFVAFFLLLLLGYAFSWVGAAIGLWANSPEVASSVGFLWMFPVAFVSSAFVPLTTLPDWLQPVAEWNPLSLTVAAARDLFGNPPGSTSDAWPMQHPALMSLLWSLAIILVSSRVAVSRYRKAAAH